MAGREAMRRGRRVLGIALLAGAAGAAQAATSCVPSGQPGIERCVSGLPPEALARMQQPQRASNWCWAASISMVLRRYGVQVRQEDVVRAYYGSAVNVPADAGVIGQLLNRNWRDPTGRLLAVSAAPLPQWRRRLGLLAPEVIADLEDERPLLLGARQHAMVLVQVVYDRAAGPGLATTDAPRLVRAVVLDPASELVLRSANAAELDPELLARVAARADDEAAVASR